MCLVVFCFMHKTAYEMRISDWSSDVCSSDPLLYEGERLKGLLGFYYLDASADTLFDVRIFNTFAGLTAFTEADVDTTTFAIFGDATFDLSDRLSLPVGGRYTWDKREAFILLQNYLGRSPERRDGKQCVSTGRPQCYP